MARTAVTVLGMQVPERWEQRGNGALASRDTQKPVKCGADGRRARGRVAQASPTFPAQMSVSHAVEQQWSGQRAFEISHCSSAAGVLRAVLHAVLRVGWVSQLTN
jgi:hypothetical protein